MIEGILKKKLEKGECVFGTWSMLSSASVVNAIGNTGLDFVIIDMEHGSMSFETAEEMVRAAEISGCQPIIRTSDKSESNILRALETGSRAVMVPHISTPQEAASVVKASRYAPDGARGLSPYTRVHGYSHEKLKEKLAKAN
ncbi:MAG: aldolase/citrate lyase family protein, partial [Candidatus Omnitrophota bacterium]|nr:aldolase/citrate lyase family protein [Candidatus Omnitrophota bacterium]